MWKHKNFINLQLYAGETWVLNESLTDTTGETGFLVKVNFTSNSSIFTEITLRTRVGREGVQVDYDTTTVYDSLRGSGWTNEAYRTITFDEPVTDNTLLTWLQANGTKQSPQPTLTFKHFYDAGTIGSGTVKFRHYSQQEPSSARLINFTINGTAYQAEEGMTWQQWVNSSYNTYGCTIEGSSVKGKGNNGSPTYIYINQNSSLTLVSSTDSIIKNATYEDAAGGAGN